MNKNYRVIYNESTQTYTAVAEIAKGRSKSTCSSSSVVEAAESVRTTGFRKSMLAFSVFSALIATPVFAATVGNGYNSTLSYTAAGSDVGSGISDGSIAISDSLGAAATTYGPNATAIGNGAKATDEGAIAIGTNANTAAVSAGSDSNYAIAIGNSANVNYTKAIAIGNEATVNETQSLGLGIHGNNGNPLINTATDSMGTQAYDGTTGYGGLALGDRAQVYENGIALGSGAQAVYAGVSVGYTAYAENSGFAGGNAAYARRNAVAVGRQSYAATTGSVSVGHLATSTGTAAMSMGDSATASGERAIAIGAASNSDKNSYDATQATVASGANSIAMGTTAKSTNEDTVALGTQAQATASHAAAVGSTAQATGTDTVAFGYLAQATGLAATAVGTGAQATANGTLASGSYAVASGASAIALGNETKAQNEGAVSIGSNSTVTAKDAVAVGRYNTVSGEESAAVGAYNTITVNDSFVLGNQAKSTQQYSVVLGAYSEDKEKQSVNSAEVNGVTYSGFAGADNVWGVVSVGNDTATRQIVNVAPGEISATSTDAINGSQLYMVANQMPTVKAGDNVTVDTSTGDNGQIVYTVNAKASETTSPENYFHVSTGDDNQAAGDETTNKGTVDAKGGALGDYATAAGINAQATAESAVAVGTGAQALSQASIAIGQGAVANIDSTNNGAATAVGRQSKATGGSSTALGSAAVAANTYATALGSASTASGAGSIAAGAQSNASGGQSVALGRLANASGDNAIALGSANTVSGANASAIGVSNKVANENTYVLGSNVTTTQDNSVVLGANSTDRAATTVTQATVGNVTYGSFAGTPTGIVSVGAQGSERQIINVAAGEISATSTDAINGSQLYAVAKAMPTAGTGITTTTDPTTGATVWNVTSTGSSEQTYFHVNSSKTGNKDSVAATAQATGVDALAAGANASASSSQAVAVGTDANASSINSVAIGYNSQATGGISAMAIGSNVKADGASALALGNLAQASGQNATALGSGVNAFGVSTVALGTGSRALVERAIAIGENANAAAAYAVSIGTNSKSLGQSAVAIGSNANASSISATSIGQASTAGIYGTALGANANNADRGVALGYGTQSSTQSAAVGYNTKATGGTSSAFGSYANANADNSIAIGYNANASVNKSVALGDRTTTTAAVPTTSATVNGISYSGFAGTSPVGVVSVGNATEKRQIQNVAAGQISASSTDAINGSQLYATNNVIGNVATSTKKILGGNAAVASDGTISMSNIGGTGKSTVDEAIKAANSKVAAGTNVASVNTTTGTDGSTTYTVNAKGTTVSNGSDKVSVTSTAKADNVTDYAVDLSDSAKASLTKADSAVQSFTTSVNGSNVETIDQSNTDVNFVNGTGTTARSVDGNITFDVNKSGLTTDSTGNVTANTAGDNFATAAEVADAINKATAATEKTSSVAAGSNTHVSSKVDGNNTEYTVSADKATVSVSDALKKTESTSTDSNGAVTTDYALDLSDETKADIAKGVDAKTAVDSQGLTFTGDSGSTDVKKLGSSVAVNGDSNITTTATSDGIKVALNKDLTGLNSVTATTITGDTLNGDTLNVGPVVINSDGINAGNKVISNVADGNLAADSKEAVNGSQLYTTNQNVTTNANNIAANTAAIEKGINYKGNNGTAINQALGGTINIVGTNSGDNTDAGANIFVRTNGDNVTVELAKALNVDSVTAGDTVLDNSGVTVGDKVALTSDGLKAGDVSVSTSGINAGNQQITNVAEGTKGTDAVNLNQLNAVKAAASSKVAAGTNVASVGETKADDGSITYTVNAKGTTASKGSDAVTVTAGTPDADNVTDYVIDLSQASKDSLAKADTAVQTLKTSADGTDAQTLDQTNNTANFISGDNIELTASSDGIKVATKKDVTFDSVTTGNTVMNTNGVTVGDNVALTSDGLKAGDVSVSTSGINAGNKQITNVASGLGDTKLADASGDTLNNAANIGDLQAAAAAATTKVTGDQGVSVTPSNNEDGSVTYTVAAKTDGTTIKVDSEGQLTATTTTLNADNAGKIETPANAGSLITAGDVANAINAAGFTAKANGDAGELINAGDEVEFINGNNIEITRDGGKFTVATAKDVKFDSVTTGTDANQVVLDSKGVNVGGNTYISDAGLDANSKKITNVAAGEISATSKDAVNGSQLFAEAAKAKTEVTASGLATVNSTTGANGQTVYNVDVAKASNPTVTRGNVTVADADKEKVMTAQQVADAITNSEKTSSVKAGNGVTVTAGAEDANGNTEYTVAAKVDGTTVKIDDAGNIAANTTTLTINTDGSVATPASPNALATAGDIANAINSSGWKLAADGTDGTELINPSDTVTFKTGSNNLTVARDGANITYDLAKDISVDSVTATNNVTVGTGVNQVVLDSKGVNVGGNTYISDAGLDANSKKITNVAAGEISATSKDAVNGSQLFAEAAKAKTEVTASGLATVNSTTGANGQTVYNVDVAKASNPTVTRGNVTVADADKEKVMTAQQVADAITNSEKTSSVKAGNGVTVTAGAEDANGNTEYTVAAKVDGTTVKIDDAGNIAANTTTLTINTDGSVATPANPNALATAGDIAKAINQSGFTLTAQGSNGSVVNPGETVDMKNTDGNIVISKSADNNDVVYNLAKNISVDSVTATNNVIVGTGANQVVLDSKGVNVGGNTYISDAGLDANSKKITNVAAGEISATSTDAVNGSQLYGTNQNVANNAANIAKGISYQGNNGMAINKQLGETINIVGANEGSSTDKGANIFVRTNSDNVTVELAKDVKGLDSLTATTVNADTVKAGDTTVNNNGVTISNGSQGSSVSLTKDGLNNGGNKITNIAAGEDDTDAVNVSQLKGNNTQINNRIDGVESRANAGVAQALATAGLPQAYLPGKSMLAVGGGVYRGETGYAVGFSSISDGGNWIIKGTASGNSRGNYGATAAVGYQW